MSRVQALVLALVVAVVAFAAGRVLGAEDRPEPPAPIVVDGPADSPDDTAPGTSTNAGDASTSTTRPPATTGTTSGPAIVPPPTVGPTTPPDDDGPGGDGDDDDGGGDD